MIEITKIIKDGFEIPVPPGFSELTQNAWCAKRKKEPILDYDRITEMKDGRLVTRITLKK